MAKIPFSNRKSISADIARSSRKIRSSLDPVCCESSFRKRDDYVPLRLSPSKSEEPRSQRVPKRSSSHKHHRSLSKGEETRSISLSERKSKRSKRSIGYRDDITVRDISYRKSSAPMRKSSRSSRRNTVS